MIALEKPINETERLRSLRKYKILDTPVDGNFDRITALAASIFKVPIAIISLVDADRIWFKSHHGVPVDQIGRDPGLCASAILSPDPHILTDAKADPRSLANPLVAGDFGLRFYAGVPLRTSDGYMIPCAGHATERMGSKGRGWPDARGAPGRRLRIAPPPDRA